VGDDAEAGPRIGPGGRRDVGALNLVLARLIGRAAGGPPPNLFLTLGRHRGLFRRWLLFAAAMMPRGTLPRTHTELLILRTAHNCGCVYEWSHHEHLARDAGLSTAEIAAVREGPGAGSWTPEQRTLLEAADELHRSPGRLPDGLWTDLRARYTDSQLIELCMLVGHYRMLAQTINTLGIEPDPPPPGPPPRAIRFVRSVLVDRPERGR
jgi:AhpD family alkylhydroperoxidase